MASDGGTGRPLPSLILLGIVDFVCVLMAAESYRDRQFFAGIVWLIAGIASSVIGYYWPQIKLYFLQSSAHPATTNIDEKPPKLLDLFKKDFPSTLKASDTDVDAYTISSTDGSTTRIKRQTYEDYEARTKFIGFYVSRPTPPAKDFSGQTTFAACIELLNHNAVHETFDHFGKQVAIMSGYGDQMTTSKDLTFSGRVLIYHEEFLPIQSKADILKAYQAKGLAVTFRGHDYLGTQVIAWHQQHDGKAAQ
jgi:hypothetical protein